MKKQILKATFLSCVVPFFIGCSGGSTDNSEQAATDQAVEEVVAESTESTETEIDISQIFIVWHEVADYDAWKVVYDGNSDAIRNGGMTQLVIGRDDDNQNNVFVAHMVNDLEAARVFVESDDLKAKMEEGGVSEPEVLTFIDVVSYVGPQPDILERMLVRHRVADWDAWSAAFEADGPTINESGLSMLLLGTDVDDSNVVNIAFVVHDQEKAEAYMNSDELKQKMADAGVEGEADVKFFTISEYADLD